MSQTEELDQGGVLHLQAEAFEARLHDGPQAVVGVDGPIPRNLLRFLQVFRLSVM